MKERVTWDHTTTLVMHFINDFIDEDSAIQIYKLARKDIIRCIPEAYFEFHVRTHVRKFGAHRMIRFRSFNRFVKELRWMMAIIVQVKPVTCKNIYFLRQIAIMFVHNKHFLVNILHGDVFRQAIKNYGLKMCDSKVTMHIAKPIWDANLLAKLTIQ